MKIALAQMSVAQSAFDENLEKADTFASKAKSLGADLVLLPEMFLCGFNYKKNLQYIKANQSQMLDKLSSIAKKHKIYLCGTTPFLGENAEKPFNRFWIFDDNGAPIATYDKLHLFSIFKEDNYCSFGENIVVAQTKFGKIGLAVCYDLRFGELFAKMAKLGAEIILVSAAWPHPRLEHWNILVKARALENQLFVAAVNQCGIENFGINKIEYFGASQVIAPSGKTLTECKIGENDAIAIAEIDLKLIAEERAKIPVISDRRPEIYDKY